MGTREEGFIPSETWFGEYMGEQGLRYALNKTPKEVETEGKLLTCSLVVMLDVFFYAFCVYVINLGLLGTGNS